MWKKRKPRRRLAVRLVKCSECGRLVKAGNFCNQCGHKIRLYCNCWILHCPFDCGHGNSCPGNHLYVEIITALKDLQVPTDYRDLSKPQLSKILKSHLSKEHKNG